MEIGDRIGKYIITEVLHGGMSEVYRVAIEGASIRFVIKRLKEGANKESRKLFQREMRILRSLKHIFIIEVLEEHYEEDCPYYVMPSCSKSLVDAISCTEHEKIELALQACEGIAFMHSNGVRHRDIKPQNILIKDGIVKIADFGLSRFSHRDSTTLTDSSLIAGTQGFIPPEYVNGGFKEGTIAGDIYMLGKTIYFLFSNGGDVSNVRLNRVPQPIGAIVEKSTREIPEERYSSLHPVIEGLQAYKKALEAIDNLPKSIEDIRSNYPYGSEIFNEELYKHFNSIQSESTKWGESLRKIKKEELIGMLNYKKDYINILVTHFIKCIDAPSDYIQFADIDQFVKFAQCAVSTNSDVAINQQLISFLLDLSIAYNRWPSMNGIVNILNTLISKDPEHYQLFIFNHKSELKEIEPYLEADNIFNSAIARLISS